MNMMTMNMSSGRIEQDESAKVDYGDEIMSSGWNPALGMVQVTPKDKHVSFPAELADVDIEQFLKKMYG